MGFFAFPRSSTLMAVLWSIAFLEMISVTSPFAFGVIDAEKPSAYNVLKEYNCPIGLLPVGVTGYELNRETGEFAVYVNETCKYKINQYTLEYKSTITGVISKGKLRNLTGVRVFVILLWINIVEVTRDGDELDFSVGIASANFAIDNFKDCPRCGCGFNCNKLKNSLVFSS
ncbi:hypothetical protein JCGZ_13952 [Jatropha curcas]|uniref:Uncharacterized protein n=2 Tax=Jatropha curcas TaxID=180498 RepID=A0A067JW36_JATCU|nr:hypothetical protein JCGZ_13952 [Jatropha curcas]